MTLDVGGVRTHGPHSRGIVAVRGTVGKSMPSDPDGAGQNVTVATLNPSLVEGELESRARKDSGSGWSVPPGS